jgi:branched-chain amino acid transport system permease protein
MLETVILCIINGLILGFIYGLMTVGITFTYGIMKTPNFAYGEFYMIGAYASYFALTLLNISTLLTIPFSLLAGFALGYIIEMFFISDMYKKKLERPDEYAMLVTLGFSILLQNVIREFYSPFMKSTPPLVPGTIPLYIISIRIDRVLASILSAISLVLMYLFVERTKTGRSWRAAAQNKIAALITGVNIERACRLSYSVGGALAALAGCMLAPLYGLYPSMGYWPLTISFTAMTLGGLGSLKGSFIGGMLIGLAHTFTANFISSSYADVGMYAILIITILVKPTGLFGVGA